jgi:hypothetical protein
MEVPSLRSPKCARNDGMDRGEEIDVSVGEVSARLTQPKIQEAPASESIRKTTDATSLTPYRLSSSLHTRLRSGWPRVAVVRRATGRSRCVQRLIVVRYFSRIRRGSSGRQGTSASGAEPTSVSGSVSSHAKASKATTRRISSISTTRIDRLSAPVSHTRATRSAAREYALLGGM